MYNTINNAIVNAYDAINNIDEIDMNTVRDLTRDDCVNILEGAGFQVYDEETTYELRQAVNENIEDGTFPRSILMSV